MKAPNLAKTLLNEMYHMQAHTYTHTECKTHLRNKHTNDSAANDPGIVCDETLDGKQTALSVDPVGHLRGLAPRGKQAHVTINTNSLPFHCSIFFSTKVCLLHYQTHAVTAIIMSPSCDVSNRNNNHNYDNSKKEKKKRKKKNAQL